MNGEFNFLKLLGFLLVFGSVLFLAYVTTRYIAGKSSSIMKGKYINIVDTLNLGVDKRLYLIKVGGEYMLIASSGKSIMHLASVKAGEDIEEITNAPGTEVFSFKTYLNKYIQNIKPNKSNHPSLSLKDKDSEADEGVFLSNLNKLKEIAGKTYNDNNKDEDDGTNEE